MRLCFYVCMCLYDSVYVCVSLFLYVYVCLCMYVLFYILCVSMSLCVCFCMPLSLCMSLFLYLSDVFCLLRVSVFLMVIVLCLYGSVISYLCVGVCISISASLCL